MKNLNKNYKLEIINCTVSEQFDIFRLGKTVKKLSVLAYMILFTFTFSTSAFAQSSSTSTPIQEQTSAENDSENSLIDELENVGIGESGAKVLEEESKNFSTIFEPPAYVKNLAKRSYQVREKIDVVVRNVVEEEIENYDINIENLSGDGVDAEVSKNFANSELTFIINPEAGMSPGKYRIKVVDIEENRIISQQDFNWGVLAINTNKSIYMPGETADIHMAVLDENGDMVCSANVTLTVRAPWGETTENSTENNRIWVNPDCNKKSDAILPDFQTDYLTTDVGRYLMTLTAETGNGTFTITDRFEVREYVAFDVDRKTATRIYPPQSYPVRMVIKANEDFKGKIVESVPLDFQIRPAKDGNISYQEIRSLPESFDPEKEYKIPELPLPFKDAFPLTQGFGDNIEGHGMELAYKRSGIDGHDGLDFGLPTGTPVISVGEGRVILAEEDWVYGHTVVIEHEWGRSYYGHLSKIQVKEGTSVKQGEVLGLSGSTGLSTGPHLHFSIKPRVNEPENLYYGKIDPAPFFGLASVDEELSESQHPIGSKAVVWNVDVKKGSTFTIGYDYKAPEVSPYFYKIGPLQFISSDFQEDTLPARFDVQVEENPFVLGDATQSAQITDIENVSKSASTTGSGKFEVEAQSLETSETAEEPITGTVVFEEIRQWQIAVDAVNYETSAAAAGNYTVSVNIGTADTNRLVVVYAMAETGQPLALSNVTVDSKSCNWVATQWTDSTSDSRTEMWYCDESDLGASNGTVNAALVGYGTAANWAIHAIVYTGISQSGPNDSGTGGSIGAMSACSVTGIDVSAGGVVFLGGANGWQTYTATYTSPLTERTNADPLSADAMVASGTEASAQTGKTYTMTWSPGGDSSRDSCVAASWDEYVSGPTNSQILRHGSWFSNGVEQPFYF